MLLVSDMLAVAAGRKEVEGVASGTPARFTPEQRVAPVVVWNVCAHCNMTCPHCYAAAGPKPSRQDLSTDAALQLVRRLAEVGVKILIFSGGEPLLRGDLLELMEEGRRQGIGCQLSTNGVLIDGPMAERLKAAGVGYVGISIDGLPEFNDGYRGLPGGYRAAMAAIGHCNGAGMRTGVRMTVTRANAHQMRALYDRVREQGAHRFYISHLVDAGRARSMISEDLSVGEARGLMFDLFALAEATLDDPRAPRIVTGGNDSDGPLLMQWIDARFGPCAAARVEQLLLRRGGNSAGEGVINIDHRGDVHPDQFWRSAKLGNVRSQSLETILAHPLRAELVTRAARLKGRCGECRFLPLCRGSHRERALARYDDMWGPDPSCLMHDEEIAIQPKALGGVP